MSCRLRIKKRLRHTDASRRGNVALGSYIFCRGVDRSCFWFSGNCGGGGGDRPDPVLYFPGFVPDFAHRRINAPDVVDYGKNGEVVGQISDSQRVCNEDDCSSRTYSDHSGGDFPGVSGDHIHDSQESAGSRSDPSDERGTQYDSSASDSWRNRACGRSDFDGGGREEGRIVLLSNVSLAKRLVPTKKSVLHETVDLMNLGDVGFRDYVHPTRFSSGLFPNTR